MKKRQIKIIIIAILILLFCIFVNLQAQAVANMGMSISKTSAYVGDSFSVTISGINGKVSISGNSNVTLNKNGNQWVDGSLTITGTAKAVGTGKIIVTPIDVTTTGEEPEEVTTLASRTIEIKEKVAETPTVQTPTTKTKSTTTTKTTKTTTTTTKTEEIKKEDDFYITKLTLKGVKENGEKVDIALSPEFNKNTYEYNCNIGAEIQKIEFEKEAGKYTSAIVVTGGENLKEGENVITLMLSAEDHEAKTYTIKVVKEQEKQEEIIETIATTIDENEEVKQPLMFSIPLWIFIIMQVLIIAIEVIIIYFVPWRKIFKRKVKNIDIEE